MPARRSTKKVTSPAKKVCVERKVPCDFCGRVDNVFPKFGQYFCQREFCYKQAKSKFENTKNCQNLNKNGIVRSDDIGTVVERIMKDSPTVINWHFQNNTVEYQKFPEDVSKFVTQVKIWKGMGIKIEKRNMRVHKSRVDGSEWIPVVFQQFKNGEFDEDSQVNELMDPLSLSMFGFMVSGLVYWFKKSDESFINRVVPSDMFVE